jgi:hypothetical protein
MDLILADAFGIVLELARQNVADETDMPEADPCDQHGRRLRR